MRRFSLIHFAFAGPIMAALFGSSPLHAQAPQTFVSSTASPSNTTCSRTAPCQTLQAAFDATVAGGEIVCLDTGNVIGAGLNINHSITINCAGTNGTVNSTGILVNTAVAGVVVLKGLDIDMSGSLQSGSPPSGLINFIGAGLLQLENVRINGVKGNRYSGIYFNPIGAAKLIVADSSITNIGDAGIVGGIYIKPASGVMADVSIQRSRIDANSFGIVADGTGGGIIHGIVSDSFVTNNRNNGITVSSPTTSTVLTVDNTRVSGNGYGLVAGGPGAGLLVGRSVINANVTGLFTTGGAPLLSYRDNRLNANTTADGAFTGSTGTQ
jgi:hypothetical protein